MDPAWATIIAAALGGTSVLGYAIKAFVDWRSGRAQAEREENQSLVNRAAIAEARVDWETAARRITQELAGKERRKLLELGQQLEPWPSFERELGPRP